MSESTLPPSLAAIREDFLALSVPDRLQLLLEFFRHASGRARGARRPQKPGNGLKNVSPPVFITVDATPSEVTVYASAPEEAPTTRGFASILVQGLHGMSPEQVLAVPPDFPLQLGLQNAVSMLRLRGMSGMLWRIKRQVDEGLANLSPHPVNLYRVIPQPPEVFDLTREGDLEIFVDHYAATGSASVRAIMVTNSAGDTIDAAGTSENLSHGADRKMLGLLREASEAVVVGASTIRREPVPLPRTTPLVVLSASGDLHGHTLYSRGAPGERLLVATPVAHQESLSDALEGLPWELLPWDTKAPPEELQRLLEDKISARHLLVEGGRVVWEFCAPITTELLIATTPPPRDPHQGIPPWWLGSPSNWELRSLFTDDAKMLYYRHEIASAARPGASL